jgi:hypothetical protein
MTPPLTFLFLFLFGFALNAFAAFVHPGGLHIQADYNRMAAKVAAGQEPWLSAWNNLLLAPEAQLTWNPAPATTINRNGTCSNNYTRTQADAHAIYYHALRWRISGDVAHANKAIQIMDAWSSTLTGFCADQHGALAAGHVGYLFAVGGETLRGYSGWSAASQTAWANMLVDIFYPMNYSFLYLWPQDTDPCSDHYRLNWWTCNLASMMAIGVFADQQSIFDEAVWYFKNGRGNMNIARAAWFVHENGLAQAEEAGRDPGHDWTGWDNLTVACEIAWNQGVDLWGFDNNRVLRTLEYNAKHNLGNWVPFVPFLNCSVHNEPTIYPSAGSTGPHSWERAFNHYVNRRGLAAPYVAEAAARLRPDGPASRYGTHPSRFDWLGLGSLTHYRDPIAAGAIPAGLAAKVGRYRVDLTWNGSAYAQSYNIKRATIAGGPYTTIARVGRMSAHYVDAGIAPGTTYYYRVSANNPAGESANSNETVARVFPRLQAHYRFDSSSGTTATDSSGNGLNGTLLNGASWTAGNLGNAVNLNGASKQYVSLPAGVTNLTDFTISTWVNLNTVDTFARIFDFGMDTERYMFLTPKNGGGKVAFVMTQGSARAEKRLIGPAALGTGWQHVAVTVAGASSTVAGQNTGGVATLYVNGVAVATDNTWFHVPSLIRNGEAAGAARNWIGRSQFSEPHWADPYLNGKVDDFRIYAGALTPQGVVAIMTDSAPPLPPAPPAAPSVPGTPTATANSHFNVVLSWSVATGADSYNVKRATTSGGPFAILGNVAGTSFADLDAIPGVPYFYVVTALNNGGESGASGQRNFTVPNPVASGVYQVRARHSGKSMEVVNSSTALGGNVAQLTWAGTNNQRWELFHLGGGDYRFNNVNSALPLEVSGASTADGANINQWEWLDRPHQKWKIESLGGGFNRILSTHSGKAVDVQGASTADGGNIYQWTWQGGNSQQWEFLPAAMELRLRSGNFSNRHMRHAAYRVRIDPNVSPAADSHFRIVPGLANAGGVSIESVNFPGRFMRVRANGEVWTDLNDNSTAFKNEATFRRVPGLADIRKSSFQMWTDSSRYLRHASYLIVAQSGSGPTFNADATFSEVAP